MICCMKSDGNDHRDCVYRAEKQMKKLPHRAASAGEMPIGDGWRNSYGKKQ